ncbi:MAG: ABC transporter permease [Pirellulales bacterium]|nr:ABC transporter permease [Pirellulales bacterium]
MPEHSPPQAQPPDARPPVRGSSLRLRGEIHPFAAVLLSIACILVCLGLWWYVTAGATPEERIVNRASLPSPVETFSAFKSLWFDRALTRNIVVTLKRVSLGFALAALVGVPLGVLAGCFPSVRAFVAPLVIFGRNIPIAALIGLTFLFFGIGEAQKVMFIFFACVAFVLADTTASILDIGQEYVDTAYTLGASRWQTIIKVLVPLALPTVFNSLRLLFGLAFGYVMLAELVRFGSEAGGLGNLINVSLRQGPREHVYLIVLIIPAVALAIDRLLFVVQRSLFPYRYGGGGLLNHGVRKSLHLWDDVKRLAWKSQPMTDALRAPTHDRPA